MNKNLRGQTAIELILLFLLFGSGFIVGHLVESKTHNLWSGLVAGFMTCYGVAFIYSTVIHRLTKAKEPSSQDHVKPKREHPEQRRHTEPSFACGSRVRWSLTLEHDKMRTALCIIFVATLAWAVIADSSVEPQDYTFVIQSPHRGYYAVQVLQSWSFQTNGQPTGRFKLSETGRFEVSRATDGERVWQTNTVLGLMGNLYLADDPDYVVEVAAQLSSCGLTGLHGGKVADAPSDKQQEILNKVALRFYRRGSLLAGHSLRDIDVPVASIEMSVSHVYFFEPMTAQSMGHWDWPVDDLANSTNPRFNKEDRTFSFFGNDKRERVFDYATGKIVRIETKAQADARMRALRDCLTTERKEKASDAPTTPPIVQ